MGRVEEPFVRILGPVEVRAAGGWASAGAGKPRALLALLALRPRRVLSRARITAELWGDAPPRLAANQVHGYVVRLRRLLGGEDLLRTRPSGYELAIDPDDVDEGRFEALAAAGSAALAAGEPDRALGRLAAALDLWRGPALADVPATPLITGRAAALEERRIAVAEHWADALIALGRPGDAVAALRPLTEDHPLREPLWTRLITVLALSGRGAEAVAAFGRVRDALAEIELEPGPELAAVHRDLKAGRLGGGSPLASPLVPPGRALHVLPAAAPVPQATYQLPPDLTDYTGRTEVTRLLAGLLGGDGDRTAPVLMAVTGQPGVGKTALAVHVAHAVREDYPDGQLYVGLGGTTSRPRRPGDVLEEMVLALGGDPGRLPAGTEARASVFRAHVAGRRLLIVLDDAEGVAQLRPLLPGTGASATLVTSRDALPELPPAQRLTLAPWSTAEALALLGRVIGARRATAEPEAARAIVDRCARLPLAVRIAGARLAADESWRLHRMAERLAAPWQRLGVLRLGDLDVAASIAASHRRLTPDAARALGLLAALGPNDFTSWGVAAMLDVPSDDVVQELVQAHLMESAGRDPLGWLRFRLPDLVRVYARERVEIGAAERDAAVRRMLLRSTEEIAGRDADRASLAAFFETQGPIFDRALRYARERDWRDVAEALARCRETSTGHAVW